MNSPNSWRKHGAQGNIEALIDHYNHQRCRERLNNVTSADVYFGCGQSIPEQREGIKRRHLRCGACIADKVTDDAINQMSKNIS